MSFNISKFYSTGGNLVEYKIRLVLLAFKVLLTVVPRDGRRPFKDAIRPEASTFFESYKSRFHVRHMVVDFEENM